MLKRYLGLIALACALAGELCAQNTTTFGSIVTGAATCGGANCVYYQLPPNTPYVVVAIAGTWAGTIKFQSISAPNATYANLNTVAWTTVATETGNGTWSVATGGATYLLVQASAWSSGLARVNMAASETGSPLSNPVFPGGITASGMTAPDGGSSSNCWTTAGGSGSCSSGGSVSGQASGVIPLATGPGVIGAQSHLSDDGTSVTASENFNLKGTSLQFFDPTGAFFGGSFIPEGVTATTSNIYWALPCKSGSVGLLDCWAVIRFNAIQNKWYFGADDAIAYMQTGGGHDMWFCPGGGGATDCGGGPKALILSATTFNAIFGANVQAVTYQETLTTPASSSAACTAGQFTDDAGFHYVCTATNTWKRVALSSF